MKNFVKFKVQNVRKSIKYIKTCLKQKICKSKRNYYSKNILEYKNNAKTNIEYYEGGNRQNK